MKDFKKLKKYFPELSNNKIDKFKNLYSIYEKINSKINLISRKDFEILFTVKKTKKIINTQKVTGYFFIKFIILYFIIYLV